MFSDDNPYSESHFRTLKYRPDFPDRFGCIEDGRSFCQRFFAWYYEEHRHSGIELLTPALVHYGGAGHHRAAASRARCRVSSSPGALRALGA